MADDYVGKEFDLPQIGHNAPPLIDPERLAVAEKTVREWADAAGEWLDKGEVVDDEHAGQIKDLRAGARKLMVRLDDFRKDAKAPHLDAGKKIDAEFAKLLDPLKRIAAKLEPLETAYLKKKQAALDAERRRQQEEAAKAAREAQEAAQRAAERHDVMGEAEAAAKLEAAQKAQEAAAREQRAKIESASGGTRATGLRTLRHVRIINAAQAFMACRDDAGVVEAIERALSARVRSKDWDGTVPAGCEIITEEKAA